MLSTIGMIESENWMWATGGEPAIGYRNTPLHAAVPPGIEYGPKQASYPRGRRGPNAKTKVKKKGKMGHLARFNMARRIKEELRLREAAVKNQWYRQQARIADFKDRERQKAVAIEALMLTVNAFEARLSEAREELSERVANDTSPTPGWSKKIKTLQRDFMRLRRIKEAL